ncbi:uncharacterized protein LOC123555112 [Mercenaria mercenaria]|uniref:uncharacterized protein LOC123555112 n=1 Tax=Mercenaria mercenaria TaxID=6596 RepID=UPI00234F29EB|nr:uncharacterized protein LOC123555112 [Mercenaria mercenaria]
MSSFNKDIMDFPPKKLNNRTDVPGSGFRKQEKDLDIGHNDNSDYSFARDPDKLPKNATNSAGQNVNDQNKNIWPQKTKNNLEFNDLNVDMPEQILRSSSETKISYAVINDVHITRAEERKKENRKSPRNCRIIQAVAIFVVLAVLGLIAFFIIRNMVGDRSSCDTLPSVENGNVNITQTSGQTEATVYCKQGYGEDENQTLTCKDDKWTPVKHCRRTGCGPFPTIANGFLSGKEQTFGSTAKLRCNSGFMVNSTTYFTCLSNGTWDSNTEPTCFPHPCGQYHLSKHVVVKEDFSHVNMSIDVQCEDGFDFANESETYIYCDNNTWIENPRCEIPGKLALETKNSSVLISGKSFSINCTLTQSPKWETVMFERIDFENSSITNPLLTVTNINGNSTTDKLHVTYFRKNVTPLADGVSVILTVDKVQCNDTGIYICSVLAGNITSPKGIKSSRKHFKAIDASSKLSEIIAQTSVVQGDKIEVKCIGSIGQDENGTKLGEMFLRIYKDENTVENVSFVIESSETEDCQTHETINATILITNDMNRAELQCVMIDYNGNRQKRSVLLNVTTTTVRISTSSPAVNIGSEVNMTCELNHIRGWSSIEIRKNCSNTEVIIGSSRNNQSASDFTMEKHMILSENDFTESSAKLVLHFENVTCRDACGHGGDIEYMCAVKIEDSWVTGSMKLEFQRKPSTPVLSTEQDKFYLGQEAVIKCTGNVGIPTRNMTMKENSVELPARLLDSEINLDKDTCANVQTITYTFAVIDDKDGFLYHCETSYENRSRRSNVETVNVTDPILYFSDESKTAFVGSSKDIQCVLTSTMNMTDMVISKLNSEICKVNGTGVGSCASIEFSAYGNFSLNGTIFTMTMTLQKVSCDDYDTYTCRAVGTETLKTSMEFLVKSVATVPELRLPTTLVEDQKAEWEDQLNCTAELGYPEKRRRLEVQIKLNSSDSFTVYKTLIKEGEGGDCRRNASIYLRQAVFRKEHNGSTIRCVILNNDNEVIASSTEKELKLLKNVCLAEDNREFDLHPFSCQRYVWCVGERLYDRECAGGSCSTLNSQWICGDSDCTGCP